MAGVSGSNFPPFQSTSHAFRPALRKLCVNLELPENISRMNGRPVGLRRCPSRLKLHSFTSASLASLVFASLFGMPKPMFCEPGWAVISSTRSVTCGSLGGGPVLSEEDEGGRIAGGIGQDNVEDVGEEVEADGE